MYLKRNISTFPVRKIFAICQNVFSMKDWKAFYTALRLKNV